jgi:hypothetical protein
MEGKILGKVAADLTKLINKDDNNNNTSRSKHDSLMTEL